MSSAEPALRGQLDFHALDAPPDEIRARFRWARARGHPGYVWPDVPIDVWRACGREIERIARAALRQPAAVARVRLPAGADAGAFGIAAFSAGMGPLLGLWLERGTLRAPADVAAVLALHLAHGRARADRQHAALRVALDALAADGIDATVVKGAHTGGSHFPEPGVRPAADVDLVLDPRALAGAEARLAAAGFSPGARQRQPYKCDWIPPGGAGRLASLALAHADAPFALELHDSLDRVFFGVRRVSFGPLHDDTTIPLPALHPRARALAQPLLAAFLATHASEELHHLQLIRLFELALVLRGDGASGALAWPELTALLERADALRFAYPAFELTERLAPGTLDPAFRARLAASATPRMRRIVGALSPGSALRPDRLSLEERFLWTRGPVETVRRAAYLLWPRHAARSRRPLRAVYAERLYRIVRGRVSVRAGSRGPTSA
jgi:Uncharacterised nucleotidyltransferase